ncbi:SRPBCC domain-containing protein [Saccharomonospora piscinae]|uniref:SRPBCC domain-containing protein n=1 Tax=Saccharomonospora piscinae TaxID=687388 RepID=UPI000464638F|nr:SRPBCC domain-containing protein [Saccharomonospora piscinae]
MIDIADRLTATYREARLTTADPAADATTSCGLVVRRRVRCALDTAWSALTEPSGLDRWPTATAGALEAGAAVRVADADGTVLDRVPPHLLAVTWGPRLGTVTIRLAADDQATTVLELVHTGLSPEDVVYEGPMWDVAIAVLEHRLAGNAGGDCGNWRVSTAVQTFGQHAVSAWVRATEVSGLATAEALAPAAGRCLRRVAPDLTRPAPA